MPEAWARPVPMGSRLCWYDGEHNQVVPVVALRPLYTDERGNDLENGWHAVLPTENGSTIELTFDPDDDKKPHEHLTQWLYVKHPQFDYLIEATVRDGHIVFDPRCDGEKCDGCLWCMGTRESQWWEYVTSAEQVKHNLARLGSLPIKALV